MFSPMVNSKKNDRANRLAYSASDFNFAVHKSCTGTAQVSPNTAISPYHHASNPLKTRSPRAEVLPHNPEVVGSNPTPATTPSFPCI